MEKNKNKGDEIWDRAKVMIAVAFLSGALLSMIIANAIITIANTIV